MPTRFGWHADHWSGWVLPPILILGFYVILDGMLAIADMPARSRALEGATPLATVTDTATPISTLTPPACGTGSDYVIIPSLGAGLVPGRSLVADSRCDECTVAVSLPFTYTLYGRAFNSAILGSNGVIGFVANSNNSSPSCLPSPSFDYALFLYWSNLDTQTLTCSDCGIYTSTSGLAPNRIFNIEWRARTSAEDWGLRTEYPSAHSVLSPQSSALLEGRVDFEARLYEGQDRFDFVYGHVDQGGAYPVVGVQRDTGSQHTQYACDGPGSPGLQEGLQLTFRPYACGEPTFTPTSTAIATSTPTSTPTGTVTPDPACGPGSDYVIEQASGAALVPGVTDIGNHCLDCTTTLYLPFPVQLYGHTFSSANVSSHGNVQLFSGDIQYQNSCLPYSGFSYAIMPYWDDVRTNGLGSGIFVSTSGTMPNRIFNIEWRTDYTYVAGSANFELRLYEGQDRFDFVYGEIDQGGSSATIGAQKDTGSKHSEYSCGSGGLRAGTRLTFRPYACGEPTFTPTATPTAYPSCGPGSEYVVDRSTGVAIVPGTADTGNHCLDCTTTITLPFTVQFYGQAFNTVRASSHGNLQFASSSVAYHGCLPEPAFNYALLAHWADVRTDISGTVPSGIYTSVSGSAPNRIFNIEWRACWYGGASCGGDVNFEARLYEGQDRIDVIYGELSANRGAAVGAQRGAGGAGGSYTLFTCAVPNLLSPGLRLTFRPYTCGEPTYTPTPTITVTYTRTPTPTLSPTHTRTRTPTCGPGANYAIQHSQGAAIVPGTNDIGNHCLDCVTTIALPFPVRLYDRTFTSANVSSHGNLQFLTGRVDYQNVCLPHAAFGYAILPYWDDVNTGDAGSGVFTSITGAAPERIFNIEWRTRYFAGGAANFEVRLYENSPTKQFDIIYGEVDQAGTSATVGVQGISGQWAVVSGQFATAGYRPLTTAQFTQYECDAGGVQNGLKLTFYEPACVPVALVGHVTWQGRPAQPHPRQAAPITMTLRLQSGGPAYEWPGPGITVTTTSSGVFTVPVDSLAGGVYNWRAKGPKFLAAGGAVTLTGDPVTNLEVGPMLAGDCNNDNTVSVLDFIILKNSFGKAAGEPGYDDRADLTGDQLVTIPDFILLSNNFGLSGDPPIASRVLSYEF